MEPAWGLLGVAFLLLGGLLTWRLLTDPRRPIDQRRYRDARDRGWPLVMAVFCASSGVLWLLRALLS